MTFTADRVAHAGLYKIAQYIMFITIWNVGAAALTPQKTRTTSGIVDSDEPLLEISSSFLEASAAATKVVQQNVTA
jgi:hypothetical protein